MRMPDNTFSVGFNTFSSQLTTAQFAHSATTVMIFFLIAKIYAHNFIDLCNWQLSGWQFKWLKRRFIATDMRHTHILRLIPARTAKNWNMQTNYSCSLNSKCLALNVFILTPHKPLVLRRFLALIYGFSHLCSGYAYKDSSARIVNGPDTKFDLQTDGTSSLQYQLLFSLLNLQNEAKMTHFFLFILAGSYQPHIRLAYHYTHCMKHFILPWRIIIRCLWRIKWISLNTSFI